MTLVVLLSNAPAVVAEWDNFEIVGDTGFEFSEGPLETDIVADSGFGFAQNPLEFGVTNDTGFEISED